MAERKFFTVEQIPKAEDYSKIIVADSVIEESKVFSKIEILEIVQQIAAEEGFDSRQLEIEGEGFDEKGNLIKLDIRVKKNEAVKNGWGEICYTYIIKGKHSVAGFTIVTMIARVYSTLADPKVYVVGGAVAEYDGGEWKVTSNAVADAAEDIKIE